MAINAQINTLQASGDYEVIYPQTIPSQVENLLNNNTKTFIGLTEDSTPDDAFRQLYLLNVLGNKSFFKLKIVTLNENMPLYNIPVNSNNFIDSKNNPIQGPIYTDENGEIEVYFSAGNVTLSIKNIADLQDWSQSYEIINGEQYNYTVKIATVNFRKYTQSQDIQFSSNVNQIDVTCVGGGGGGGAGSGSDRGFRGGGGGGGGYCVVQEDVDFQSNTPITITIGAGGLGGVQNDSKAGSGGITSFGDLMSANGGDGGGTFQSSGSGNSHGGTGAYYMGMNADYKYNSNPGVAGTVLGYSSFSDSVYYGGGGGGGGMSYSGYTSGASGGGYGGAGGDYNGSPSKASNGQDGYGGGGGGDGGRSYQGGKGGSGCVTIRIHLKYT